MRNLRLSPYLPALIIVAAAAPFTGTHAARLRTPELVIVSPEQFQPMKFGTADLSTSDERLWAAGGGGNTGTSGGGDSRLGQTTYRRETFLRVREAFVQALSSTDWSSATYVSVRELFQTKILPQNPVSRLNSIRIHVAERCQVAGRSVDLLLTSDFTRLCVSAGLDERHDQESWFKIANAVLGLNPIEQKPFRALVVLSNPVLANTIETQVLRLFNVCLPVTQLPPDSAQCEVYRGDRVEKVAFPVLKNFDGEWRRHPDGRWVFRSRSEFALCQ